MRNKLVILFLILAGNCLAQISPGDLTTAHANLEGLSNCTKCHEVGKKVASAKCLDCHKEIRELASAGKGYHASADVKSRECFACHNEHHGRNFKIIRFDTLKFSHRDAGFELLGKHNTLSCKSCHKSEFVKVKRSQKTGGGSYLGLGTACLDCHEDFHQKNLSSNCLLCHNNNAFKPVLGFDHKKTKYPLLGKHQTVDCSKCHKITETNGKKIQKFSGIAFANCTDCHKDVHDNKFGKDCKKCHNENSFQKVAGLNTFNHDKTGYPLVGKHQSVECKSCHKTTLTANLNYANCTDCHKDYHKGQLKKPGVKSDCKDCHTLDGFKPAIYTLEQHNQGVFPLEGSHLATPCFACHKKGQDWIFKDLKKKCVDCHENIHRDYIGEKFFQNQSCESCHSVVAWNKVQFDHNTTKFKLTGKHAETTCKKCHFKPDANGLEKQQFSSLTTRCLDCHADTHNKQFDTSEIASCTRCHDFDRWKPAHFNHDTARFKLDGSHKDVACAKCHKEISDGTQKYILYKLGDIRCASCHLR